MTKFFRDHYFKIVEDELTVVVKANDKDVAEEVLRGYFPDQTIEHSLEMPITGYYEKGVWHTIKSKEDLCVSHTGEVHMYGGITYKEFNQKINHNDK